MKRKKTTNKKVSTRIPPSVPKSVRRCTNGYMTDFISVNNTSVKFLFIKTASGYAVHRITPTSALHVDMATDNTLSPTTRNMFSGLTTLKSAIETTEKWLGHELPYIR